MSFNLSRGLSKVDGLSFWFKSTPPRILSVGNLPNELNTAVGPNVSVPDDGLAPSANGVHAFRPSGVAAVCEIGRASCRERV